MNWVQQMKNICEIAVNPASGYSGREPYVNGRTDERTDDTRHTITWSTFVGRTGSGLYINGKTTELSDMLLDFKHSLPSIRPTDILLVSLKPLVVGMPHLSNLPLDNPIRKAIRCTETVCVEVVPDTTYSVMSLFKSFQWLSTFYV